MINYIELCHKKYKRDTRQTKEILKRKNNVIHCLSIEGKKLKEKKAGKIYGSKQIEYDTHNLPIHL